LEFLPVEFGSWLLISADREASRRAAGPANFDAP